MRSAVGQAQGAATTAANTGTQLGAEGQGIGSTLTPFLTSELQHPEGYSQEDMSGMLSNAEAGAGGATSAIAGKAAETAAQTRNAGGFQAVLDDAARDRTKAAASVAAGISAKNADVKQDQTQSAAKELQGMYGTDVSGMLDSNGQVSKDVDSEVNADKQGWLQNTEGLMSTLAQAGSAAAGMGFKPFGK